MKILLLILVVLFPCLLHSQPRYPTYFITNSNPFSVEPGVSMYVPVMYMTNLVTSNMTVYGYLFIGTAQVNYLDMLGNINQQGLAYTNYFQAQSNYFRGSISAGNFIGSGAGLTGTGSYFQTNSTDGGVMLKSNYASSRLLIGYTNAALANPASLAAVVTSNSVALGSSYAADDDVQFRFWSRQLIGNTYVYSVTPSQSVLVTSNNVFSVMLSWPVVATNADATISSTVLGRTLNGAAEEYIIIPDGTVTNFYDGNEGYDTRSEPWGDQSPDVSVTRVLQATTIQGPTLISPVIRPGRIQADDDGDVDITGTLVVVGQVSAPDFRATQPSYFNSLWVEDAFIGLRPLAGSANNPFWISFSGSDDDTKGMWVDTNYSIWTTNYVYAKEVVATDEIEGGEYITTSTDSGTISSTSAWTNTQGCNITVYCSATIGPVLKKVDASTIHDFGTSAGTQRTVILHPNWYLTGTGVAGSWHK